ncbi:MAG: D-alanyl-D-alanine carboxypeptidase/D-alanyl-D-alanine-endopeptidase [Bdellovibrionales bacterium]|nr:D-alanyl-D-alanine carboxypeptidase/D-alanyl-D-alanine-endopeptidase [Bdellovibrionales bacterium]
MRSLLNTQIFLLLMFLAPFGAVAGSSLWTLDLPDELPADPETLKTSIKNPASGLSWGEYFKRNPRLNNMKLGLRFGASQVLSKNESEPMLPASITKIFTAAAALKYLGPDYRFENSFSGGLHREAFLLRNPVFRISGDPTWGHEAFEGGLESTSENLRQRLSGVVRLLREANVQRVQGPILIESLRPALAETVRPAGWRDAWKLECMAVFQTEFQANGNCGQFVIRSLSRYGWVTDGVNVPVRVKLLKSKEGANNIKVAPIMDERGRIQEYVFSGYFANGPVTFDLPVHQGAEWLRNLFVKMLNDAGIKYDEAPGDFVPNAPFEPIEADLSSRRMLEILQQALPYSINGVMDRIFLEVGFRMGESGSVAWMTEMIRDLVGNEALMTGVRMEDGSGLSLLNRMRADVLYEYISRLRNEEYFEDLFSSLAVAGKSGTLLNRATLVASSHTYGRIHAKTGTLNGITNLAGYFLSGPGATPEPFVVLSESGFSAGAARPLIDGIVVNFAAQNSGKVKN